MENRQSAEKFHKFTEVHLANKAQRNGPVAQPTQTSKTIESPIFQNWEEVWLLAPVTLQAAQSETYIPRAIFCIDPYNGQPIPKVTKLIIYPYNGPSISQGSTFLISQFSPTCARYVVVGCVKKEFPYAYLRIIGVAESGVPLPYDHDFFPLLTIAVPAHKWTGPLLQSWQGQAEDEQDVEHYFGEQL
jgi:hypothetical protein